MSVEAVDVSAVFRVTDLYTSQKHQFLTPIKMGSTGGQATV